MRPGDDIREDIIRRKLESVAMFERTLREWKVGRRRVSIRIDQEGFDLWLGFVNDMRLVLGTELGIKADDWSQTFVPSANETHTLALLHFLSWLEEELVRANGFRGFG